MTMFKYFTMWKNTLKIWSILSSTNDINLIIKPNTLMYISTLSKLSKKAQLRCVTLFTWLVYVLYTYTSLDMILFVFPRPPVSRNSESLYGTAQDQLLIYIDLKMCYFDLRLIDNFFKGLLDRIILDNEIFLWPSGTKDVMLNLSCWHFIIL